MTTQDYVFQVKQGRDAEDWLQGSNNIARWRELHAQSRTGTSFLSPEFALAWTRHYRHTWTLVLIIAHDAEKTQGIMPLARQGDLLTGVGAHQAEYHGWLCDPQANDAFLSGAIDALFRTLPNHRLRLRYVDGPGAAVAAELARRRANVLVEYHSKPLLKLDRERIDSVLRKKSNKSKVNRLKRDGTLTFETIVEPEEFENVLDSIIALYDFRQGATNDSCPFRSDANKKAFHLDWFRAAPEQFHITCLRLNGEVIGALIGVTGGADTSVAIIAFSPEHARHSPGKIHIYRTARTLSDTGGQYLDLTPGDDPWKERFATEHASVLELNAYAGTGYARWVVVTQALLRVVRKVLTASGTSPSAVRANMKRVRRINAGTLKARGRRLWPELTEYRVYRIGLHEDFLRPITVSAKKNSLDDLAGFSPSEPWQEYHGFLSTALTRIESGDCPYTICTNGVLVHCGWVVTAQDRSFFSEVGQSYTYPEPGAVLYDFYTAPAGRNHGYYQNTIGQMLVDLKQSGAVSVAYISVLADNGPSRHVIEKVGFKHIASLFRYRAFGYTKTWQQGGS